MYSKKNVKYLGIPKEVIVASLSEYINELSNIKVDGYYFRGENDNYRDIKATGLRKDEFGRNGELKFINYIEEFYKEIAYKIDEDDKKNFIWFCQYYGIPTNLVDITKNPLIALYFACQSDNYLKDELGFVYLFDKNNIIDISYNEEILNSKNLRTELLSLFMLKSNNSFEKLYNMMKILYEKNFNKFKFYMNDVLEEYKGYRRKKVSEEKEINLKKLENALNGDKCSLIDLINDIRILSESLNISIDTFNKNELISIYVLLVAYVLRCTEEFNEPIFWIHFLPILSYEPLVSFDRRRGQYGLFLYQLYFQIENDIYGRNMVSKQRIWPDKIIVIQNKEKILKELYTIGVNKKSVFGDLDSIAQYIKNS
ncbi:FRG domain-containing protein [Clostridium thermobutyricum]|uniref:FRG domain-containing protein n=1 Tax=Clostridium thermobutyricum TaxID=29372 RepID=UPI0018A8BC44|nr:FRG domain-containing protein [Clostridium thermobutyricum]